MTTQIALALFIVCLGWSEQGTPPSLKAFSLDDSKLIN